MRVLLTGGGTGGHVNPALAIADIIKAHEPSSVIAYAGTEKGIERKLVEKEGYKFYNIKIQGIKRSLSPSNIKTAYLILTAPKKAEKIIKDFKPDIVIGTGGYVCWAPLKAAASMGIPTVIHESNSVPGLAVRKLEDKVDLILTNFAETAKQLKNAASTVCVGNPIRQGFDSISKAEAREKLGIPDDAEFVILSFGGSLGAPRLNEAAIDVMRLFGEKHPKVYHFHSGGRNSYAEAKSSFESLGLDKNSNMQLKEYIYDMPLYMSACDLVICRAGAMTLTELAILGKPAILIPSPYVTDNHQYKNAASLADKGAAVLVEEDQMTAQGIANEVQRIYQDRALQKSMSTAIHEFANPNVGEQIYEEITKLIKNKSKIKAK